MNLIIWDGILETSGEVSTTVYMNSCFPIAKPQYHIMIAHGKFGQSC